MSEEESKYKGRTVKPSDLALLEKMYGVYVDITREGVVKDNIPDLVRGTKDDCDISWPADKGLHSKVTEAWEALSELGGLVMNMKAKPRYQKRIQDLSLKFRRKICSARELYDNIERSNENDEHSSGNDELKEDSSDSS